MKLPYISLILFQICTLSLFGMSPEEKTVFKVQLKAARTSQDMEQVIQGRLGIFSMDRGLKNGWRWDFANTLYYIDEDYLTPPVQHLLRDISPIIEDCIFEELYALLLRHADDGEVNMWLKKYSWADKCAVHISVGFTAKIKGFLKDYPDGPLVLTDPDDRLSTMKQYEHDGFLLTKTRLLQYGNPEYIRSREQQHALLVTKSKSYWVVVGGLAISAVLGGILYKYWWQDDEENEVDQETIKIDDVQDASVSN